MSCRPRYSNRQRKNARAWAKSTSHSRAYGNSGTRAVGPDRAFVTVPLATSHSDFHQMVGDEYLRLARKARCVRYSNRIHRWHHRDGRRRGIALQGR